MAVISQAQARNYASQAGFSGQALNVIVAIAQAESSLNTGAQHVNGDGSVDRGIMQINNRWHPEVSDACAYNAACAFGAAYRISSSGSNFSQWSTYTGGAYLRYLNGGITGGNSQLGTGGKQWYNYPISHGYITNYQGPGTDTPHYAVDLAAPMDTPVSFLVPGTIKIADYQAWGGEVFEQPDAPGRPQEYVYHLDVIQTQVGQHVNAGQVIGLSGGQTSGGQHPTSPQYSTGPHVHFGEFTNYVNSPNGTIPYGPDPTALVDAANGASISATSDTAAAAAANTILTPGGSTPTPMSEKVNNLLSEFPGFGGIALALDEAEQFQGIVWYSPGTSVSIQEAPQAGILASLGLGSINFDSQDYIGAGIRSILDTIYSNTMALMIRGILVFVGLLLIVGLIWNALNSSGVISGATNLAKLAVAV